MIEFFFEYILPVFMISLTIYIAGAIIGLWTFFGEEVDMGVRP